MKNKFETLIKYEMLKIKFKRLKKDKEKLKKDLDYIFEENQMLKKSLRSVEQEKRMQFLIKRENKLQLIEQLAKAPKRDTRKIMKLIMEES